MLEIAWGHEVRKVFSDDLVTAVAGEFFSRPVQRDIASAEIVNIDGVLGIVEELAIAFFAFTQRFLDAFALSDVISGREQTLFTFQFDPVNENQQIQNSPGFGAGSTLISA